MDMKVIGIAIAVVAVVAIVGGVAFVMTDNDSGIQVDENGKAVRQSCDSYTVTDLDGKTYTFDYTFGDVVIGYSGSGGPFATLAALLGDDLPKYLTGIDNSLYQYRLDMYEQFCKDVPGFADLEKLGGVGSGFDASKVVLMEPDAFITSVHHKSTIEANGVDKVFEKAKIPIIYIDYTTENMVEYEKSVKLLGKLFGKEDRAQKIVDYYKGKIDPVISKLDTLTSKPGYEAPLVYIEVAQYGPNGTSYGKSQGNGFQAGIFLNRAGGNSLLESGNVAVDKAYILTQAAEIDKIIFLGSKWATEDKFINLGFGSDEDSARAQMEAFFEGDIARSGWSDIKAYQDGEVYAFNMPVLREVYDFATQEFFAKAMFPTEFADLDPQADIKDFYEKFMPVTFDGVWYLL